ncbi:MAG: 4Fe-4S binding protein [Syntrophomonas sp.]
MAHVITDECIGCGSCIEECPTQAISESNDVYTINPDLCTDCANCKDNCPADAIKELSE